MLKAVLFDFDGTIYDSINNLQVVPAIKKLGWKVPDNAEETVKSLFGYNGEVIMTTLFPNKTQEEKNLFLETWQNFDLENLKTFPGDVYVLQFLQKKDVHTGIVTHRWQEPLLKILRKNQLMRFFDPELIQGKGVWKHAKPDPRVFDNIFAKLSERGVDIEKDKIIYVGDSETDIMAAMNKRIEFVGVETGLMRKKDFLAKGVGPGNVLKIIHELPSWLERCEYL